MTRGEQPLASPPQRFKNSRYSGSSWVICFHGESHYEPWDGGHREVRFNAHEGMGNRPARGWMRDDVYAPDGTQRRVFEYDVQYVRVDGDYAWFGALCLYDSAGMLTGHWLYVRVQDGATPGRVDPGDWIGWYWGTERDVAEWVATGYPPPRMWWRMAIEGNLVVHTY